MPVAVKHSISVADGFSGTIKKIIVPCTLEFTNGELSTVVLGVGAKYSVCQTDEGAAIKCVMDDNFAEVG